jgi:hypothetical protein
MISFLQVEGVFYTSESLERLMFDELKQSCRTQGYGGFLPGMKQIGNVAALPGIVGVSFLSEWTCGKIKMLMLVVYYRSPFCRVYIQGSTCRNHSVLE